MYSHARPRDSTDRQRREQRVDRLRRLRRRALPSAARLGAPLRAALSNALVSWPRSFMRAMNCFCSSGDMRLEALEHARAAIDAAAAAARRRRRRRQPPPPPPTCRRHPALTASPVRAALTPRGAPPDAARRAGAGCGARRRRRAEARRRCGAAAGAGAVAAPAPAAVRAVRGRRGRRVRRHALRAAPAG